MRQVRTLPCCLIAATRRAVHELQERTVAVVILRVGHSLADQQREQHLRKAPNVTTHAARSATHTLAMSRTCSTAGGPVGSRAAVNHCKCMLLANATESVTTPGVQIDITGFATVHLGTGNLDEERTGGQMYLMKTSNVAMCSLDSAFDSPRLNVVRRLRDPENPTTSIHFRNVCALFCRAANATGVITKKVAKPAAIPTRMLMPGLPVDCSAPPVTQPMMVAAVNPPVHSPVDLHHRQPSETIVTTAKFCTECSACSMQSVYCLNQSQHQARTCMSAYQIKERTVFQSWADNHPTPKPSQPHTTLPRPPR